MSLADKRAMKLQTPAGASAPAWSPTGEVIAYLEPQGPNSTRVAFVDRRGRALYTNLPHEPYVEHRASGIDECGGLAEVRAHRLSVARPSSAVSLSNPAGVAVNYSG